MSSAEPTGAVGDEAGRSCPYCRFPLKEGAEVVRCPVCGAVHHAECWEENGGCAVVGCAGRAAPDTLQAADAPARAAASRVQAEPVSPSGRGGAFWFALSAFILAAGAGAVVVAFVLTGRSPKSEATNQRTKPTPAATITVSVTTTQTTTQKSPAAADAAPSSRAVGVPSRYSGRFTAVDRLERCNATATYVYCSAGPSGKAVRLGGLAVDLGVRGSADLGGPSMPEGASFRTPNGRFECDSSYRGISCRDLVNSSSFVIGDYEVRVANPGRAATGTSAGLPSSYRGYFASVDRRERCFATNDYAVCSAGPSGKAVKLVVGDGAAYQGVIGSADRGGPAMPEGTSFTTPSGAIRCGSSTRGITCTDRASGDAFVIGDTRVHVINGGSDVIH
jgi:hypothetical protein